MKGLLHSKIFRKNFKKWLCMYVGALLLLTTVITYSKYISKYNVDDEARVTKFDVTVDYVNPCTGENNENCTYQCTGNTDNFKCTNKLTFRATKPISHEFTINSDFEVNTLLVSTISVDTRFEILKLEDITDASKDPILLYDSEINKPSSSEDNETERIIKTINEVNINNKTHKITKTVVETIEDIPKVTSNLISITRKIDVDDLDRNVSRKYRIKVVYKYNDIDYTILVNEKGNENMPIINVGYSANQEN